MSLNTYLYERDWDDDEEAAYAACRRNVLRTQSRYFRANERDWWQVYGKTYRTARRFSDPLIARVVRRLGDLAAAQAEECGSRAREAELLLGLTPGELTVHVA